jgi:hypothetical protein
LTPGMKAGNVSLLTPGMKGMRFSSGQGPWVLAFWP